MASTRRANCFARAPACTPSERLPQWVVHGCLCTGARVRPLKKGCTPAVRL